MSTTVVRGLPELAAEITREHDLCEGAYRTALAHARQIGSLLTEAKAQVDHGDWLPWVRENTPLAARTAQQYMQLAGLAITHSDTHLPLTEVVHAHVPTKPPADLRTALSAVDESDARAALAELGPVQHEDSFPDSAMQRTTWRQIQQTLGRVTRAMDEGSADGLSKWSRREALQEAARHARSAGAQLSELAGSLGA